MSVTTKPIWASLILAATLAACSQPTETGPAGADAVSGTATSESAPEAGRFTILVGGTEIGALEILPSEDGYAVEYEYRNNGRGPTITESIALDEAGLPVDWTISGASTFGNPIDESYAYVDSEARWQDATGSDQALPEGDAFYVPQDASPYWLAIAARALMARDDMTIPALPGGELRLAEIDQLTVSNGETSRNVTTYALSGTSENPTYFLMDDRAFFGLITPGFAILEAGYEGEDERLRALAAGYGASRFSEIQARVAHDYDGPVRIRNVRVFDPQTLSLGEPVSVVVEGEHITAIDTLDVATQAGETEIDGAGGSLIPGLFEMHAHMGETSAFLNIAAGVTSVRDMGNNNAVLDELIGRIEAGEVAGPRVHRSGFIEGRSPFSSNNGILVASEEEAVAAVETYAASGDFIQVKVYNSMNPDWVPAVIEAAHANGLRVAGHVPAFTNANSMIAAGYDEMTHINQIMLGWVLEEGEDTRSLLRLTALRRLPALDLNSEAVQATIAAMAANGTAVDPTYAIHEALLLSRNGEVSPGVVDYIDNMPVDTQRGARSAWADIATPEDDANYRGAFDQITETLRMMREAGIFIVPGTDLGGSFAYHRELELYQNIGMTPAEIIAWGGHGMAEYLGVDDELGTIAPGMLADFFLVPGDPTVDFRELKTIALVSANGVFYYPTEIYPEFGIQPFTDLPAISQPR
ncbi:amidohydrolase family protein [Maricaulis maris]|uniref:Imidazolonepropionase-like amidohydrolase n=1 Tax=Maricaulis maris TaxID=74318 RepID=A0A495D5D3_9PROT|nr:amidohydrolase family protein [Maricaulis maris]RKQ96230.1 imidazolonepropionase-like amidohydrolase [Maricaulis maris]